jgi:hypothetical protein
MLVAWRPLLGPHARLPGATILNGQ